MENLSLAANEVVIDMDAHITPSATEIEGCSSNASMEDQGVENRCHEEYYEAREEYYDALDNCVIRERRLWGIEEMLDKPSRFRPVTIFRLPSWFHEKSKELCEPKMVSIGPFHHGKKSLRPMEEYKESTLLHFLARNKNVSKEYYLEAMRSLEAEARQCYSEKVKMKSDKFVKMLLLDGCFILEWFTKRYLGEKDVVYGGGWARAIFSDMCLLENQLPFFVIHKLKAICDGVEESQNCKGVKCPFVTSRSDKVKGSQNGKGVNNGPTLTSEHDGVKRTQKGEGIINWFKTTIFCGRNQAKMQDIIKRDESMKDVCPLLKVTFKYLPRQFKFNNSSLEKISSGETEINHLLDFYYQVVLADIKHQPGKKEESSYNDTKRPIEPMNIPCVSELQDAGVTFEKIDGDCNLLDITFDKGTILMPCLLIQNDILTILWNMVAFEQSYHQSVYPRILSSYLALMDALIDTEKDVTSLQRCGILKNFFPTTEEAAKFFNQFSSNFSLDYREHYFFDLFNEVNEYSNSFWPKHRARLMQDYFSSPWSIISFAVAAILLALTVLQTYYSAPK